MFYNAQRTQRTYVELTSRAAVNERQRSVPKMNILNRPWEDIKVAICSGIPIVEVAKHYKVNPDTLRKRISRGKWPAPSLIQAKVDEVRSKLGIHKPQEASKLVPLVECSKSDQQSSNIVEISQAASALQDVMVESWLKRGESHKALVYDIATQALKGATKKAKKIQDWQDIERADKAARRAAGLDSGDEARVNVNLQLVNARILAMQDQQ